MKSGLVHENPRNITTEWYTPPWVFEMIGLEFDLDPCHPSIRIPWVPASAVFVETDDGLSQPWRGRVWLNPPYGRETPRWLEKMSHHMNGIALVFSRTDCQWFHEYLATADGLLFLRGRVRFVDGHNVTNGNGPGCGSVLASWGRTCTKALMKAREFGTFFPIMRDIEKQLWLK